MNKSQFVWVSLGKRLHGAICLGAECRVIADALFSDWFVHSGRFGDTVATRTTMVSGFIVGFTARKK